MQSTKHKVLKIIIIKSLKSRLELNTYYSIFWVCSTGAYFTDVNLHHKSFYISFFRYFVYESCNLLIIICYENILPLRNGQCLTQLMALGLVGRFILSMFVTVLI